MHVGIPSPIALDIMEGILNASGGSVFIGIFQVISRNRARRTAMLRRAQFLDVANVSGADGIFLEYGQLTLEEHLLARKPVASSTKRRHSHLPLVCASF